MTEETLFELALKTPLAERAALLDQACEDRPELRARIERLLAAHEAVEGEETRAAPTPEEAAGLLIAGKYRLLQLLGEGGMGSVWMADQLEPVKRRVALKLIRAERANSSTILARFEAERQAIALMDHPNIAKLLDAGTTAAGSPFFVMELVKGVPLDEHCDSHKLGVVERLHLFMQICSAVQHAHQKGVIHRDLKPSNILVESHDGRPTPKVIDFGLAKALSGQPLTERTLFTALGAVAGTPLYMAPEQARFDAVDVDTRADVYALGVILYELLTGSTPIERERLRKAALDEILRAIRETEPPTPSQRLSSSESKPSVAANRQMEPVKLGRYVRGDLDWIVMKALSKERDRRYETANGFARDVERFLNREPVSAGPPSAAYRAKKFVTRNRGVVAAVSIVVLSLAVGVAGATWGMLRAAARAEGERLAKLDALEQKEKAEKSATAERLAKEQTARRLKQVEKGVETLGGLLSDIRPRSERLGAPSIYERLTAKVQKAADALDGEEVGDALAVAKLQAILGRTLLELGDYEKSSAVLEKAAATYARELGAEHRTTLGARARLAAAYGYAGKNAKAIEILTIVRDVRAKKFGPKDRSTLSAMVELARAYRNASRQPEAIDLLEKVIAVRESTLGRDAGKTLAAVNDLALLYRDDGRAAKAVELLERVRDVSVPKLGALHADSLAVIVNLASAYREAGMHAQAISTIEKSHQAYLAKFGPDHPHSLTMHHELALALKKGGRASEALPYSRQAADGVAKLNFRHTWAHTIVPEAIATHEAAGKYAQAEGWRRKWLPVVEEREGSRSAKFGSELGALGLNLLSQKKWEEAEPVLRQCLAVRDTAQPDDWRTFNVRSMIGGALLGQKKFVEAERMLAAGYEGMEKREKTIPSKGRIRLVEAADRLALLHESTGNKSEAETWRSKSKSHAPAEKTPESKQ